MSPHGFLPRWYCLLRYLRHERLTGEGSKLSHCSRCGSWRKRRAGDGKP